MRYVSWGTAVAAATGVALAFGGSGTIASECVGLAGKTYGDALIVTATMMAPHATIGQGGDAVQVLAPFCRAEGVIKPTGDSDIKFEVWLPPVADWKGKYQGIGNGGFGGSMRYAPMERALQDGYAVSGTDTGHTDSSGTGIDTAWAVGHPEKFVDYSWRAIHETAVAAKAIVRAYYGKAATRSYFVGCSNGGRQALMEAQRFPTDYDGIVAGAPGVYQSRLLALDLSIVKAATGPDSSLFPAKLAVLRDAALAQCGASNGVIDDPHQCQFNPARLACKPGQTDSCLTPTELPTVRMIYSGLQDSGGKILYPGFAPGSEAGWDFVAGSRLDRLSTGFFHNIVGGNQDSDLRNLGPVEAFSRTSEVRGTLDADDPDLIKFKAAGGKLIQYHGWNDPRVPAAGSIKYYQAVAGKMGGLENIRPFYRLFMGPGMGHCTGGPGPHAIGGEYGAPAPSHDPEHDVVAALDHWVERGVAPSRITASLYRDDNPGNGIAAQRPWCAFPASSHYSGHGDPKQASSYTCVTPQK